MAVSVGHVYLNFEEKWEILSKTLQEESAAAKRQKENKTVKTHISYGPCVQPATPRGVGLGKDIFLGTVRSETRQTF